MSRGREYEGDGIIVRYDVGRCIHAEECVRGLPEVFDPDRRPWIEASRAPAQAIADTIGRCPTGALTYERLDGGPAAPVPADNRVRVEADGPLFASGDIELTTSDGESRRQTRLALCRCGDSRNKPYCDNTHLDAGFTASASLGESKLKEDEVDDRVLRITLASNGPLLLRGPVTVVGGSDAEEQRGLRGALCRCGQSQNKPYCDGTHKTTGFAAE
jgi:CDGSH-type Zn-finger protein/uncharacterized Fe-S cluster protein YjdI